MSSPPTDWLILLIGGPSGVGKTIAAKELGLRFSASWLQVDDLRLALQRNRVNLPQETEDFYFFQETTALWSLPPERLCNGLIAVGHALSPALEVVIENHVDTIASIVIEGDGILPSLVARPAVQDRATHVRMVFLIEPEEAALFANMKDRNRGMADQTETELRNQVRMNWLYGQWLTSEAHTYGVPVLEPRPWSTLIERIIEVARLKR
jgi:2-phosphoglycerate kinase